jgi:hypothetical protein
MRPKQTATDADTRGAVAGTGARRRLASPRYVALLLLAAFSLSACGGVPDMQATLVVGGAKKNYYDLLSSVQSELASPTPDLMKIGVSLDEMEAYRESIIKVLNQLDVGSKDYSEVTDQADPKGVMKDQIAALTDQFDRLGGWGAANAQHQVLTSGGTWNWVSLGTNPDLNPGGATFTGTTSTSPGGGSGCPPGDTFIIGVGCVH